VTAAGALVVLLLLLTAVLVAAFGDGEPDRPRVGAVRPEGAVTPSAEPVDEPSPTPSPPPTEEPSSLDEAAQALAETVAAGLAAGELSDHVVKEVDHKLRDVAKELGKGDTEKALEHLADLREKIGEFLEKGEISSESRAVAIASAIDALADRIAPLGDEDEGDG
jgi:hypothetical protein